MCVFVVQSLFIHCLLPVDEPSIYHRRLEYRFNWLQNHQRFFRLRNFLSGCLLLGTLETEAPLCLRRLLNWRTILKRLTFDKHHLKLIRSAIESWGRPSRYVIFLSCVGSLIVKIKCYYCLVFDYDSRGQTFCFFFFIVVVVFCVHSSSYMLYQNRMWWLVQIKSIEMLMLICQINRGRRDYRKHKATFMVSLCNPSIECLSVFLDCF